MIFRQLFDHESSTYTYLVGDEKSKEAVLIDPVREHIGRDSKLVEELGLKLIYALETHIHADHITGGGELRLRTGCKTAVGNLAKVQCADIYLNDGDELKLGSLSLRALATPGHTNSCTSYSMPGFVFTGDCLLIRGCGRTDFQEGSSEKLFHSVREKLFKLPDETIVYPAHDYKGIACTSILEEKKFNPRLNLDLDFNAFKKIMSELKLPPPKQIEKAVPANLNCGQAG